MLKETLKEINKNEFLQVVGSTYEKVEEFRVVIKKIIDQKFLYEIVNIAKNTIVKLIALKRVMDPEILTKILKNHELKQVRLAIIKNKKYTDLKVLKYISLNDTDKNVKSAAVKKIEMLK